MSDETNAHSIGQSQQDWKWQTDCFNFEYNVAILTSSFADSDWFIFTKRRFTNIRLTSTTLCLHSLRFQCTCLWYERWTSIAFFYISKPLDELEAIWIYYVSTSYGISLSYVKSVSGIIFPIHEMTESYNAILFFSAVINTILIFVVYAW